MKLGTKIFFCVIVCFSVIFLAGGYSLISLFYESTIEREIDRAAEQYQYNKFIIQAAFITKGEGWFQKVSTGTYDMGGIAADMSDMVAFLTLEGETLYSEFPADTDFGELLAEIKEDKVYYCLKKAGGGEMIMLAGKVIWNDAGMLLVTGLDMEEIFVQRKQMIETFGRIYAAAIGISMVLVFGLSIWLARPIHALTAATNKIADGNYQERIAENRNDEVGQLAVNFNHMADAVEEKIGQLTENAREKEDFAANFAHELKTPLTSVIGYANRIYQKELPREEQKKAAWFIWNEGMRLEALSHKLMELTVLQHKTFELREIQTDVLLHELMEEFAYMAKEHDLAFHCHAKEAVVKVEYDLFQSLFFNIIDNAVKAGAKDITIFGNVSQEHRYVLKIQDNGCGIPQEEISRITEAFYMVDKSRSRKLHGAGIGLALAEKIAQIHGSGLRFESDGKTGTAVILELLCGGMEDD